MIKFKPISELLGHEILDGRGEFVGWIRDILVDRDQGRIEYARIALPDGRGPLEASVVVPWSMIQRGPNESGWKVAACSETLQKLSSTSPIAESITSH